MFTDTFRNAILLVSLVLILANEITIQPILIHKHKPHPPQAAKLRPERTQQAPELNRKHKLYVLERNGVEPRPHASPDLLSTAAAVELSNPAAKNQPGSFNQTKH